MDELVVFDQRRRGVPMLSKLVVGEFLAMSLDSTESPWVTSSVLELVLTIPRRYKSHSRRNVHRPSQAILQSEGVNICGWLGQCRAHLGEAPMAPKVT